MIVQELINELEGMNPEAEVRLATQPSYPFEYSVNEVVEVEPGQGIEIARGDWGGEEGWYLLIESGFEETDHSGPFETEEGAEAALVKMIEDSGSDGPVVYLVEGSQLGYLPGDARRTLGW